MGRGEGLEKKKKGRRKKKERNIGNLSLSSLVSMETNGNKQVLSSSVVTEKVWELSAAEHILHQDKMTSFHLTLTPFSRHT